MNGATAYDSSGYRRRNAPMQHLRAVIHYWPCQRIGRCSEWSYWLARRSLVCGASACYVIRTSCVLLKDVERKGAEQDRTRCPDCQGRSFEQSACKAQIRYAVKGVLS
jgi:hypothetical protein